MAYKILLRTIAPRRRGSFKLLGLDMNATTLVLMPMLKGATGEVETTPKHIAKIIHQLDA